MNRRCACTCAGWCVQAVLHTCSCGKTTKKMAENAPWDVLILSKSINNVYLCISKVKNEA